MPSGTMSLPQHSTTGFTPTGTSLPSTHCMAVLEDGTLGLGSLRGMNDCSLGDTVDADRKTTIHPPMALSSLWSGSGQADGSDIYTGLIRQGRWATLSVSNTSTEATRARGG